MKAWIIALLAVLYGLHNPLAVPSNTMLWPQGVVFYEISSDFDEEHKEIILESISIWEQSTDIIFKNNPKAFSKVVFTPSENGCWSALGHVVGSQKIGLHKDCFFEPRIVIHEIGHAIGLDHEHQRYDSGDYINLHASCMYDYTAIGQFVRNNGYSNSIGPYDYKSIMHYPSHAYATLCPSITKKDVSLIKDNQWLSYLDIKKVQFLYKWEFFLRNIFGS